MPNKTFIIIFTLIALVLGGIFYLMYPTPSEYGSDKPDTPEGVACTMDAKLCPDGSYVGRTGPNCEFSPCPIPDGAIMEDGTIAE